MKIRLQKYSIFEPEYLHVRMNFNPVGISIHDQMRKGSENVFLNPTWLMLFKPFDQGLEPAPNPFHIRSVKILRH